MRNHFAGNALFVLCVMLIGFGIGKWEGKKETDNWWQRNVGEIYWFGSPDGNPNRDWSYLFECPKRDLACPKEAVHEYKWLNPDFNPPNRVYGPIEDREQTTKNLAGIYINHDFYFIGNSWQTPSNP